MASTIIVPPGVPTKYDNTWGAALIGAFVAAMYVRSLFPTPIQLMTMVFQFVWHVSSADLPLIPSLEG